MQKRLKSKSATTDCAVRSTQVAFKRASRLTRSNLCVLSSSIRVIEEMTVLSKLFLCEVAISCLAPQSDNLL